jgi:pyruvate dehydrogenase E1 component
LLERLVDATRRSGGQLPFKSTTAYQNTIPTQHEAPHPGDRAIESRIRSIIRWNAMAMVVQANRDRDGIGGHIASFASSATLYEVGFNHFWHAPSEGHGGDLVFMQGHSAPGIYARAFLEGRLNEEDLHNFRADLAKNGKPLSSYPHPWLMPDFWQLPTVSMGLGPIMGVYQARFLKYLHHRGIADTSNRKVWVFCGDGDNLIFVVNCNLQRLDGPVRGNGKIIQELEGEFRGAGWNAIKVIWGSYWDPLLAKDSDGLLRQRMEEAVDGEYQNFKAKGGAYTREHFFGKYPELKAMVANMSDEDIWRLNRGGHDSNKVYNAYKAASEHTGQPTVILAKTVKGYGMGEAGEGQNITHQQKKMAENALKEFRDRFHIPVPDEQVADAPFYKPADDSPEIKYLHERRQALGGYLPERKVTAEALEVPDLSAFDVLLKDSGEREMSTTMAYVRALSIIARDKTLAPRLVPIVPDEARTFGMEGLFRQVGIYAPKGQLYEPQDADQLMYYREDQKGQILQEGINEAGAMSSWIAAATAYANHGVEMIPFYAYYSMFGFQRVGDLAWAAGDMQAKGFLMGGTAGRTTLNGEGLQHEDGHSHLQSATIPNCISYDPTFAYEMAVIIQDGMRRMYQDQESVFYYITMMNENYHQPAMPKGAEEGIRRGMYLLQKGGRGKKRVQLMGSGTILIEVMAAAELLKSDWGIDADLWSCPSFTELRRDGIDCERHNLLHPEAKPRVPYVAQCLDGHDGPVIASTDYMRAFPDQIRPYIDRSFTALGTDGYGRSDTRENLRRFFEVDRYYVVITALKALADEGVIKPDQVSKAIAQYNIDPDAPNPSTV